MSDLLKTKPYSPISETDGTTGENADEFKVKNIDYFPEPDADMPGIAVLSTDDSYQSEDPADYETVVYTGRNTTDSKLTGVTREVEGTKREWPDGTAIACILTAEHVKRINDKFKAHLLDEAPHEYGGRFKWQYNETDDSLELVVVE